jgi:hypothetical protein
MFRYLVQVALLTLLAFSIPVYPSHAKTDFLRVSFTKAGLVAGTGAGLGY